MKNLVLRGAAALLISLGMVSVPAASQAAPVNPSSPAGLKVHPLHSPNAHKVGGHVSKGNPTLRPEAAPPATAGTLTTTTGTYYRYAGAKDNDPSGATGAQVTMTVHKPKLLPWDYHSLIEHAVQSSDGQQVVEVGWTVDRITNNSSEEPFLFSFFWVNGVPMGYNTNDFQTLTGAQLVPGQNLSTLVGQTITLSWEHFGPGCNCTEGWWLKAAIGTAAMTYSGVYPDTLWSAPWSVGLVQDFAEGSLGLTPTQSHLGSGKLASGSTQGARLTGYQLLGGSAPTSAYEGVITGSCCELDRWNEVLTSSVDVTVGGPGGTETIPGTTSADDTPGVGTGSNPSGLGAFCTFNTNVNLVPQGKVSCIDGSAGTACRTNMGTLDGQFTTSINYVGLSLFKKIRWYGLSNNCSGTSYITINHGRFTLPAGSRNAQHASFIVLADYATCATGYGNTPPQQPTC